MRRSWCMCVLLLAACGGAGSAPGPSPSGPTSTPDGAVQAFLKAAADSDISAMGRAWGTARGSAAATHQPTDYEQRMAVVQGYLGGAPFTIVRTEPIEGKDDRRNVVVALNRGACVRTLPFQVVRTSDNTWVVAQFDLNLAGSPAKPCDNGGGPTPPQP